ncbi:hypothetical protein GcC1_052002 [Golovinomyces cichoracearum]|uniref:Uncharacterized protein n=1 Tax=Golovinomyces cichoracearum TaxID=62708 RepID=A0A420IW90_9PEZI|nr:hypothetical protein GcC1_052002 [Golovinomyces cichoracearum]
MWDVSWMDPYRETVGQRRSRKHASNSTSPKQIPVDSSRRSSILSFNSGERQQRKPSILSLFGGSNLSNKKKDRSQREVNKISDLTSTDQDEKLTEAAKWVNKLSEIPPDNSHITSELSPRLLSPKSTVRCNSDIEQSSISDAAESVFSGWTGRTEETLSTWSTAYGPSCSSRKVPTLNLDSVVPKKDESVYSPLDGTKSFEKKMIAMVGMQPPKETTRARRRVSATTVSEKIGISVSKNKASAGVKETRTEKQKIHETRSLNQKPDGAITDWKPPDTWGCTFNDETKTLRRKIISKSGSDSTKSRSNEQVFFPVPEITYLQGRIQMMEAASSKIVLERLKEEWNEIADASVYRGLELEKQLWMLKALRTSASTVSALTNAREVHHLAVAPLSQSDYPNVYPRAVAAPKTQLPYPVNEFSSISAFSMPTLFPASSIPAVLKECQRILVSPSLPASPTLPAVFDSTSRKNLYEPTRGGTVHLTILDPTPVQATIGPRLRGWLDTHLIINLERNFRCTNPSRLYPVWLADAGLNAEGSKNVHIRFFASVTCSKIPSTLTESQSGDLGSEEVEKNDYLNLELKSIAGRMLWKEMWGSFVLGEKWWWEDEEIMEECEKLATCWEYTVIEAVKEC